MNHKIYNTWWPKKRRCYPTDLLSIISINRKCRIGKMKRQAINSSLPLSCLSSAYHIIRGAAFRIIIYPRFEFLPPFPDIQTITFPLQCLYLCLPLIRPLTVKAWTNKGAQMPWNTCHQFLRQCLSARREPLELSLIHI